MTEKFDSPDSGLGPPSGTSLADLSTDTLRVLTSMLVYPEIALLYAINSRILCKKLISSGTVPDCEFRNNFIDLELRFLHENAGMRSCTISTAYLNPERRRYRSGVFGGRQAPSDFTLRLLWHMNGSSLLELRICERLVKPSSETSVVSSDFPSFASLFPNLRLLELFDPILEENGRATQTSKQDSQLAAMLRELPALDTLILSSPQAWPSFEAIPNSITSLTIDEPRILADYSEQGAMVESALSVISRLNRFPLLSHLSVTCPTSPNHDLYIQQDEYDRRYGAFQARPTRARGGPRGGFGRGAGGRRIYGAHDSTDANANANAIPSENGMDISEASDETPSSSNPMKVGEKESILPQLQSLSIKTPGFSTDIFEIVSKCPNVLALSIETSGVQFGSQQTMLDFPKGLTSLKVASNDEGAMPAELLPNFFSRLPSSLLSLHLQNVHIPFGPSHVPSFGGYEMVYPDIDPQTVHLSYLTYLPVGLRVLIVLNTMSDLSDLPPLLERLSINTPRAGSTIPSGLQFPSQLKSLDLSGFEVKPEIVARLPSGLTKLTIAVQYGWSQNDVAALWSHLPHCMITIIGSVKLSVTHQELETFGDIDTLELEDCIGQVTKQFRNRVLVNWLVTFPEPRLTRSEEDLMLGLHFTGGFGGGRGGRGLGIRGYGRRGGGFQAYGGRGGRGGGRGGGFGAFGNAGAFGAANPALDEEETEETAPTSTKHHFPLPVGVKRLSITLSNQFKRNMTSYTLTEPVLSAHIERLTVLEHLRINGWRFANSTLSLDLNAVQHLKCLTGIELNLTNIENLDFRVLPRTLTSLVASAATITSEAVDLSHVAPEDRQAEMTRISELPTRQAADLPRGLVSFSLDLILLGPASNVSDWPKTLETLHFTTLNWQDTHLLELKHHLSKLKDCRLSGPINLTGCIGSPAPYHGHLNAQRIKGKTTIEGLDMRYFEAEPSLGPGALTLQDLILSTAEALLPISTHNFQIMPSALKRFSEENGKETEISIHFDHHHVHAVNYGGMGKYAHMSQRWGGGAGEETVKDPFSIRRASHFAPFGDSGFNSARRSGSRFGFQSYSDGPDCPVNTASFDSNCSLNNLDVPSSLTALRITCFDATLDFLPLLPQTLTKLEIVMGGPCLTNPFDRFPRSLQHLTVHTEEEWRLTRSGMSQIPPQMTTLCCEMLCFPSSFIDEFPSQITELSLTGRDIWTDSDINRLGDHLAQGKGGLVKLRAKGCLVSGRLLHAPNPAHSNSISSATTTLPLASTSNLRKELTTSNLKEITNLMLGPQYEIEWTGLASPMSLIPDDTEVIDLSDSIVDIIPRYIQIFPSHLKSLTLNVVRELGRSDLSNLPKTLTYLHLHYQMGDVDQWFWTTLPSSLQYLGIAKKPRQNPKVPLRDSFGFENRDNMVVAESEQEHSLIGLPYSDLHTLILPWAILIPAALESLGPKLTRLSIHSFSTDPQLMMASLNSILPNLQLTLNADPQPELGLAKKIRKVRK